MSLAFLAKKSWHTANLKNVEKVWIAEEKFKDEQKKVEELKKQIEEERQIQELRDLQLANGQKSNKRERVDWMYDGPMANTNNTAEEYLLGKEFTLDTKEEAIGFVQKDTFSNNPTDAFSRLHEDPMLKIRYSFYY